MNFPQGACKLPGVNLKVPKTHFLLSKVRTLKICPLAIPIPLEENPYIFLYSKQTCSTNDSVGSDIFLK